MMSIADFIFTISFLIPSNQGEILCQTAAFVKTHGCLSSVLWSAIIAYSLYKTVFYPEEDLEAKERRFLLIGFGIPILTAITPFIFDMYGQAQGWCWIKIDESSDYNIALGISLRLATFYLPLWIIIPINLYIYTSVIKHIKNEIEYTDEQSDFRQALILRLGSYPLILVICFLPATVKRIYDFADPDSNFVLSLIGGVFMALQGLFDAIVYGLTTTVRYKILNSCKKNNAVQHYESDDCIAMSRRMSMVKTDIQTCLTRSVV